MSSSDENNHDSDDFEEDNSQDSNTAEHAQEVRKRIEELLEQKRLKALFDDSEDW